MRTDLHAVLQGLVQRAGQRSGEAAEVWNLVRAKIEARPSVKAAVRRYLLNQNDGEAAQAALAELAELFEAEPWLLEKISGADAS